MADPSCELRRGGWVIRIVVFAIAFVAFILSSQAVGSCRYFVTEPEGQVLGLYSYELVGNADRVCQSISFLKDESVEFIFADEDTWKVAQAFGTAGSIIGGVTVLCMFLGFFCQLCANRILFKFVFPVLLIVAGICTILTNIVFDNPLCTDLKDDNGEVVEKRACTSAEGNQAASSAFILYLVAAISMFWCMTPWEKPMYKFVDELSNAVVEVDDGVGKHHEDREGHVEPTEGLVVEDAGAPQELDA